MCGSLCDLINLSRWIRYSPKNLYWKLPASNAIFLQNRHFKRRGSPPTITASTAFHHKAPPYHTDTIFINAKPRPNPINWFTWQWPPNYYDSKESISTTKVTTQLFICVPSLFRSNAEKSNWLPFIKTQIIRIRRLVPSAVNEPMPISSSSSSSSGSTVLPRSENLSQQPPQRNATQRHVVAERQMIDRLSVCSFFRCRSTYQTAVDCAPIGRDLSDRSRLDRAMTGRFVAAVKLTVTNFGRNRLKTFLQLRGTRKCSEVSM